MYRYVVEKRYREATTGKKKFLLPHENKPMANLLKKEGVPLEYLLLQKQLTGVIYQVNPGELKNIFETYVDFYALILYGQTDFTYFKEVLTSLKGWVERHFQATVPMVNAGLALPKGTTADEKTVVAFAKFLVSEHPRVSPHLARLLPEATTLHSTIAIFQQALDEVSDTLQAYINEALKLVGEEKYDMAYPVWMAGLGKYPDNEHLISYVVQLYYSHPTGNPTYRRGHLKGVLNAAVINGLGKEHAHSALANIYLTEEQTEKAIALLEENVAADISPDRSAKTLRKLAKIYFETERLEAARESILAYQEITTPDKNLQVLLAQTYMRQDQFSDAIALYQTLTAALPEELSLRYDLARAHHLTKDFIAAGTVLVELIHEIAKPTTKSTATIYHDAILLLSETYLQSDRAIQGEKVFLQYLEHLPTWSSLAESGWELEIIDRFITAYSADTSLTKRDTIDRFLHTLTYAANATVSTRLTVLDHYIREENHNKVRDFLAEMAQENFFDDKIFGEIASWWLFSGTAVKNQKETALKITDAAFNAMLIRNPQNYEVYLPYMQVLRDLGKKEAFRELLEKQRNLPNKARQSKSKQAAAREELARMYEESNNRPEANLVLLDVLDLTSDKSKQYGLLARIVNNYLLEENYTEAIVSIERLLSMEPPLGRRRKALTQLAKIYQKDDPDKAIGLIQEKLALVLPKKDRAETLALKASTLANLRATQQYISTVIEQVELVDTKAAKVDIIQQAITKSTTWLNTTSPLLPLYQSWAALTPSNVQVILNYGHLLAKRSPSQAMSFYRMAIGGLAVKEQPLLYKCFHQLSHRLS
ncbi:MAG: tetratricopeptide repeat protein, partial [Bacteroidota bacterium]